MDGFQAPVGSGSIFWVLLYAAGLVGGAWCLVGLLEFYHVAVQDRTSDYPWGPVNENPWYYQTAATYAAYNLLSGLLFLALTSVIFWAAATRNSRLAATGTVLMGFCLLLEVVSATICQ